MTTLSAEACADLLCCSKTHLHRLARQGEIPGTKVGRGWVFLEVEVLAWLQAKTAPKAPVVSRRRGAPRKRVPMM